jgi:hypothetical protein
MNCREAHTHLFAERDGALDNPQRAALDGHVAECAACRRVRETLAAALMSWRAENEKTPVPDAEREWHAVRRRIRGGAEAGAPAKSRRTFFPWLVAPFGAAAAVALAFYVMREPAGGTGGAATAAQIARVESIEVPGGAVSSVFVDDKSGWLVVWANDSKEI